MLCEVYLQLLSPEVSGYELVGSTTPARLDARTPYWYHARQTHHSHNHPSFLV